MTIYDIQPNSCDSCRLCHICSKQEECQQIVLDFMNSDIGKKIENANFIKPELKCIYYDSGYTLQETFDSMTDDQKNFVYLVVGKLMEEKL